MSQVQIIPNSKTGSLVTAFEKNPEFGFLQLQQTSIVPGGTWLQETKRSTLLKAKIPVLQKFIQENKSLTLPGKIVIKEYLESEVPQDMMDAFLNKALDYNRAIEPYVKRAGQDGVELCYGGERIVRFSVYDATGTEQDTRVAHDNGDAVRVSIAARAATNANLSA